MLKAELPFDSVPTQHATSISCGNIGVSTFSATQKCTLKAISVLKCNICDDQLVDDTNRLASICPACLDLLANAEHADKHSLACVSRAAEDAPNPTFKMVGSSYLHIDDHLAIVNALQKELHELRQFTQSLAEVRYEQYIEQCRLCPDCLASATQSCCDP